MEVATEATARDLLKLMLLPGVATEVVTEVATVAATVEAVEDIAVDMPL